MEKPAVFSELTKSHFDDFGKNDEKDVTPDMEQAIQLISQTGASCYEWTSLKPYVLYKVDQVLENLNQLNPDLPAFKECKQKLLTDLNAFDGIPFTIQRICELIVNPRSMYKSTRKLLWALERVVNITSTVQAVIPQQHPINLPPEENINENNNEEEEEQQDQFDDLASETNGITTTNHATSSGTFPLNNSTL